MVTTPDDQGHNITTDRQDILRESLYQHSSYWSIKWYGGRDIFDNNQGLAIGSIQSAASDCLDDTNTCGNRNVYKCNAKCLVSS